jgi:3-(3-hydroxy-phenyl)propionate hydroxylase
MAAQVADRDVLVVGAGPVGLAAALALRARGISATVLEAEPADRQRPGSRAIYTHRATLEIIERNTPGLGHELASHGLVWPTKRTLFRGREVYRQTYPPPPKGVLPPLTSLPQVEQERVLFDACKAAGIEFVWEAEIVSVATDPDGVTLTTAGGDTWSARCVVGADGARSAVRAGIGAELQGDRSENSFVIVDVDDDPDHPLPLERVFHYEHPAVDGRNVLLVPFAGGWRVDLQCRVEDDPDSFSSPEGVRAWLRRVLPDSYAERVSWVSTYRFLQVIADTFVDEHRRVLLVGEAAHLFAPFGARGMNSGVADADAAAAAIQQALGATVRGVAEEAVATFDRERREAAEWNRYAAGKALAYMQARDLVTNAKRRAAALAARRVTRAGKWLDSRPYGPRLKAGQTKVTY